MDVGVHAHSPRSGFFRSRRFQRELFELFKRVEFLVQGVALVVVRNLAPVVERLLRVCLPGGEGVAKVVGSG